MPKYYQGRFTPKNPKKYAGDPSKIFFRSSWELKLMFRLDSDPNIIEWSSEELVIPYRSPLDGEVHRYFVDFKVKTATNATMLIEIKPHSQTIEPKIPKKKTKRFINEVVEWGKNSAKWAAADEYAKDRGWTFVVFTEYELGIATKKPANK